MRGRWPFGSIQGRLLVASAIILPVVMLVAGLALKKAYHSSLETAVRERLQLQVYLLLGSIELGQKSAMLPQALQEPRYAQVGSGLYGMIHDARGNLLWRSPSTRLLSAGMLVTEPHPPGLFNAGVARFDHLAESGVYRYRFSVAWEQPGVERNLIFTVMEVDDAVRIAQREYARELMFWLSVVLGLALFAQVLIMRWGIQPLKRLAQDLRRMEQGESARLEGQYPAEVQPVTDNLNRLIDSERQQRERYRNTLGDLAHSLKTPLAVMRGAELEAMPLDAYRRVVDEQVARMDQIVQYQLARAVKSKGQVLAHAVPVAAVVKRMLGALDKVYRDKGVDAVADLPSALAFAGDERDLMELLGNLLENAYKYGCQQVYIRGCVREKTLLIEIGDDGPGVSPEARKTILERGARLDTSVQGQGIGLSVAVDIVSSYNGGLEVGTSELGGALFSVSLPAAQT
jgi:two-component system sensor histidine kinase PhoQ